MSVTKPIKEVQPQILIQGSLKFFHALLQKLNPSHVNRADAFFIRFKSCPSCQLLIFQKLGMWKPTEISLLTPPLQFCQNASSFCDARGTSQMSWQLPNLSEWISYSFSTGLHSEVIKMKSRK